MSTSARTLLIAAAAVMGACSAQPAASAPAPARPAADAQTRLIVEAADRFLATLGADQKQAVQFAFDDAEQRKRWSNLPVGIASRTGLRWGDLNAAQRTALTGLLGAVLSPTGVKMVTEQMAADDELNRPAAGAAPAGGPPPGARRGPTFGSDYYYVSFLGTPSTTSPWIMQFGGHHLAINAAVSGPDVSLSPSLTGGQPLKFVRDGKQIWIVEKEVLEARAMLESLTAAQRAKAVISDRGIDLVLGPGHDGQVLQPEGLPASEMTAAQKTQFLALIESRLGLVNPDDQGVKMAQVRQTLNQTYFAWYGPTTPVGAAYHRVTGPALLLEFSPQGLGGDVTQHAHNMYRDPANEYGSAWAPLR